MIAALRSIFKTIAKIAALWAACGVYDLMRNDNVDKALTRKYFIGNGLFTWFLSPLNTLLDILSLPYVNKGVYKLSDLPGDYQAEIKRLIDACGHEDLVGKLENLVKSNNRSMVFFKWYGSNVDAPVDVPAFHEDFKYVQTIGVSVFNKKQSTSKHFGPLRATLRVLYNVNNVTSDQAYIVVGNKTSYWKDNKLFIFDDTLMHQSFNETDQPRYCLFVDILRPSMFPGVFAFGVSLVRVLMSRMNRIFYKQWELIKS